METELRNNSTIYRYKFTEDFMNELFNFSKIHQYDDRKDFKEAWELWLVDNEDILSEAVLKIMEQNVDDDELIRDKIKKTYKNRYFILTNK